MRHVAARAVVAAWFCLGAPAAVAQNKPPPKPAPPDKPIDYEAAKNAYRAGESAGRENRWVDAAVEYQKAYEITGDPVLFYKIASALQQAGNCREAIARYRDYLRESKPDEAFRERTEEHIAACEAALSKPPPPPPDNEGDSDAGAGAGASAGTRVGDTELPPPGGGGNKRPPAFVDDSSPWQRTAAWASVGAVVTFATVGTVLAASANSREEDLENLYLNVVGGPETYSGSTKERYDDLVDEGEKLELYSHIAYGAAGAAAVAATLFFILDSGSPQSPESTATARRFELTPSAGRDDVGVSARWRF